MPEFWQFPTVSMGLGPLMAIYQARFLKYLHARGIADTANRKVWVFCGDGEMDEPESLGAIGLAAREKLDNLVFVINCNLQRLDGPVRGNGKIIQELEGEFRGSGWNVIKLIWGSNWDPLLARDKDGALRKIMMDTLDGDYQAFKANDGAFVRKHFFGRDPRTLEMVAKMTDDEIWGLRRGGHDAQKVHAAFHRANNAKGQPTVLLIKTVKGWGMGEAGEGKNTAHQTKKLTDDDIRVFRDRFNIPIPDSELAKIPFYKPADDTPEMKYLHERRKALGGYLPKRRAKADESFTVPPLDTFKAVLEPTAEGREISTTQAYVRFLTQLLRDKDLGPRVVPILVDEARTFGMEGLFRQIGIYNPEGQKYTPVDKHQVMYYREATDGQILQEGINEAGGMGSWIAAATSYSTNNRIMMPFYVYYSMFGFQRIGDLAWAAGDMQARGFLLGGTSGRTTLNGEGLQHEDGHSHILAGTIPNCISYDPTFAHEVGVILHHGLKRMVEKQENVFYYLTLLNENYPMPGLKAGTEEQILKGMYLLEEGAEEDPARQPARQRHDPAREHRGQGAARSGLGRGRQRLELPELQRTGARRPGLRALEPAAPDREAARALRDAAARQACRPGDRVDRLHEELRRPDPRLHSEGPHLQGARHRRLRPQRLPQQAARALRGQPPLRRRRGAEGAGRRGHAAAGQGGRGDQEVRHRRRQDQPAVRLTARRNERTSTETAHGVGRSQGPGHRRLQGGRSHRAAGQARRHGRGRAVADHGRVGQGVDGDPVVACRRRQGAEGQARRQGRRRHAGADARGAPRRRGGARRRPPPAAAAPGACAAPPPAAGAGGRSRRAGGAIDVVVPDIGDFDEVAVIEVFVKPGDTVKVEQSLITVESDKASMEIPSSHAGVVKELKVKVGDKVKQGSLIAVLRRRRRGAAAAAPPAAASAPAGARGGARRAGAAPRRSAAPAAAAAGARADARRQGRAAACVAVDPPARARTRRAAGRGQGQRAEGPHHAGRRAGLRQGRDGRRRADRGAEGQGAGGAAAGGGAFPGLLPWPQVDFAKFGPVERKDLSRIKKISGANLHRNWVLIPHVTNHDDADITELEAFRVQLNKENEKARHQGHDARLPDQGRGRGAEEVPRVQRLARRRADRAEAVLPHRLRRRHAERPGGAGDQGRRQEGRASDQRRRWASWRRRRATASSARPT